MIKNKLKLYILLGVVLTTVVAGGVITTKTIIKNKENKQYTTVISQDDKEILSKESIVTAINEICRLEILDKTINKSIKIKEGKYFKKEQEIEFVLNAKYYIDLRKIESRNVIVNEVGITIFITDPLIDVSFDENKTIYYEVDNSLLSFGDIKKSVEETESMKSELKNIVEIEMKSDENMQLARTNASKSITNVLKTLTKTDYTVEVRFVKWLIEILKR